MTPAGVGVPDGGTTVSLLGCALVGLAGLRHQSPKQEHHGQVPDLLSQRGDGRSRRRVGGGGPRRARRDRQGEGRRNGYKLANMPIQWRSKRRTAKPERRPPPSADSDHYLSELAILPPFRGHFPLWRLDLDDFHILMRFTRSAVCD